MYCRHCGKQLEENALFCGNCGAKVEDHVAFSNKSKDGYSDILENSNPDPKVEDDGVFFLKRQDDNMDEHSGNPERSNYAIPALVTGIASYFIHIFGIVGLISILLGGLTLQDANKNNRSGKDFGIAAIVLGAMSCIYSFYFDYINV